MTIRQRILKAAYPLWMLLNKVTNKKRTVLDNDENNPPVSFYSLHGTLNDGKDFDFSATKGKKVLLVNTASNCGYTNQYNDLEGLHKQYRDKLVVIAFPANDFKEQEKGSDEEIAAFCKVNFGVSFPLMQKTVVVKKTGQHPVFAWLSDPSKNGWNNKQPSWNFSKYLIDEKGSLTHYFDPGVSPLSEEVKAAVEK
jgi:glutathione peroxidase